MIIFLAYGTSPKLTLLSPSTVNEFGNLSLTSLIPSSVFFPASENSASPVAKVNVKTSKMNCPGFNPYCFPVSYSNSAVCTFSCGVFAIPFGPMHSAIAGTPYFDISGANFLKREPSPSRLIELIIGRPGICSKAASITSGSVESITRGASTSKLIFFTRFSINSFSSERSVVATHTSRQCAPSST